MNLPLKVFILDDEPAISQVLQNLLSTYLPHVEVVGKSFRFEDALVKLNSLKPDLLFLDIRMPEGTGFDFLDRIGPNRPFEVVFVTGYEDYALQALKAEAVDYILKPIDRQELIAAMEKVELRVELKRRAGDPDRGPHLENDEKHITVHLPEKVLKIPVSQIMYFEASGNYTFIVTRQEGKILSTKTLKEFEGQMSDQKTFLRISRNVLINSQFLKTYSKHPPFQIEMENGVEFEVSRRRRALVINRLG